MNRDLRFALASIFCLFAIQIMVLVLVPLAAASIGVPGALIGLLVAVPAGVNVGADILVAVTSDRLGRRLPLVVGGVFGLTSAAVLTTASDFVGLFAGVLLFGVQMSLSVGPALAYVTEAAEPRHHSRVQGYNGAVQGLSALLAALAAGIAADRAGLPWAFAATGVLSVCATTSFWFARETVIRRPRPKGVALLGGYREAIRMLATRPALQLSSLVALIFAAVIFITGNAFLPLYVVHDLGEPAVLAGALLAVRNIVGTAVSPLFGRVTGRYGLLRTTIVSNSIGVLGVAGIAFTRDPTFLFVWAMLQGIGISFTAATSNMLVTSATSQGQRALGFAANGLVARAGGLAAPLLYGALLQLGNMPAIFLAAGLFGAVLVAGIVARGRVALDQNDEVPTEPAPAQT